MPKQPQSPMSPMAIANLMSGAAVRKAQAGGKPLKEADALPDGQEPAAKASAPDVDGGADHPSSPNRKKMPGKQLAAMKAKNKI